MVPIVLVPRTPPILSPPLPLQPHRTAGALPFPAACDQAYEKRGLDYLDLCQPQWCTGIAVCVVCVMVGCLVLFGSSQGIDALPFTPPPFSFDCATPPFSQKDDPPTFYGFWVRVGWLPLPEWESVFVCGGRRMMDRETRKALV